MGESVNFLDDKGILDHTNSEVYNFYKRLVSDWWVLTKRFAVGFGFILYVYVDVWLTQLLPNQCGTWLEKTGSISGSKVYTGIFVDYHLPG